MPDVMSIASFGPPRSRPAPGPSKPIIGISKADQNGGAVDQRVRGQTSTTRLPFPSKRIDPGQRVADRARGGAVTNAPAPSPSIIELRLVRYSRERLGWPRSTA